MCLHFSNGGSCSDGIKDEVETKADIKEFKAKRKEYKTTVMIYNE